MIGKKKKLSRLPTMTDVAKFAGVSQTTVSFVLNNVPNTGIPDQTRQRILAAIQELGYRPNVFAKNLRLRRSNIIGFVTDEIATSPHAGQIIQGAQDASAAAGKLLFLSNTGGDPELEYVALETMLTHRVEGLVYATMYHRAVMAPAALFEVPTVLLDCFDLKHRLPSVVPDEGKSALAATKILLHKGHRQIAFINSVADVPAVQGRLAGYLQALTAYGVLKRDDLICVGESDANNGYENTLRLMNLASPPTALFCFNDQVAMGAYEALHERQRRIPADVAVMGFDNLELIAAYLRPALSTMELPHYKMGQWAVKHVLEHQERAPSPVQQRLACQYIERASV